MQLSTVQLSAVQSSAVQSSAVQCSAVQSSAVQCSAVQSSAVQSSAVPHPRSRPIGQLTESDIGDSWLPDPMGTAGNHPGFAKMSHLDFSPSRSGSGCSVNPQWQISSVLQDFRIN